MGTPDANGLLEMARQKAARNRHVIGELRAALTTLQPVAISDRERATLAHLLRHLVSTVSEAFRHRLAALGEEDTGAHASLRNELLATQPRIVLESLVDAGLYDDDDLLESALHRICRSRLEPLEMVAAGEDWEEHRVGGVAEMVASLGFEPSASAIASFGPYFVATTRNTDGYGAPVLLAEELEPSLRDRLIWSVAIALRRLADRRIWTDQPRFDAQIDLAAGQVSRAIADALPLAVDRLAAHIDDSDGVSADLLVRLLTLDHAALFEALLARLSGIRPRLLRRILYEAGGESMAILARALDFTPEVLEKLVVHTRPAGEGLLHEGGETADAALALFARLDKDDAIRVQTYWSRSGDFIRAMSRSGPSVGF